jgi:hypothetical protein
MGTMASALGPFAKHREGVPQVYADANVPVGAVAFMRQPLGWDVIHVVEDDRWRRATDRDHFTHALELGRTLITQDRDFLDDRRFPPALSPGIIVCTASDEAMLGRLLVHIDQSVLRRDGIAAVMRGKKLWITASDLT